jgi:DNA phosphorothioation-associated putative methyltransferase
MADQEFDLLPDNLTHKKLVAAMTVGKRLPVAVYVHESLVPSLPTELCLVVRRATELAQAPPDVWNVVKFGSLSLKVSLLSYPAFFEEAFPILRTAWTVDLEHRIVRFRDYSADANPPVLHRKEQLLPQDHPDVPRFAELTASAERLGLFDDVAIIGLLRGWIERLRVCGVRVEGQTLIASGPVEGSGAPPVARHRTALHRRTLSTPMQLLARYGYLEGKHAIFDYGCGHGDDLMALRERGLTAAGWDPHFAPSESKVTADVVNLGFVLNVIENIEERREALEGAYELAGKFLVVSALIGGRMLTERRRLYRDGVLTQRGTFQKFFAQGELRSYVALTLKREPIAVAPGVFFVFRDDQEEQRFLAARQSRSTHNTWVREERPRATPTRHVRVRSRRPDPWETYAEALSQLYERGVALARLPETDEFERWNELHVLGRAKIVWRRAVQTCGLSAFETAQEARREDLLVYFALNQIERRRSRATLDEGLRRDVHALFGSYNRAIAEASKLLLAVADRAALLAAAQRSANAGVGFLDGEHSLQLHTALTPRLPALLRVYLGCASLLHGDVEEVDLVKLHLGSGKVTLLTYDDFAGRSVPELLERVKINLRSQEIDFFQYGEAYAPQPLYLKSRYLAPDLPGYDEQLAFDEVLVALKLFNFDGFGPDRETFYTELRSRGIKF